MIEPTLEEVPIDTVTLVSKMSWPDDWVPVIALSVVTVVAVVIIPLILIRFCCPRYLPPGPWGLPLVGYAPFIDSKRPYVTLTQLAQKYGRVYSVKLGSILCVVITDPKIIRKVLSQEAYTGRAPLYMTHGIMKGLGLIGSQGEAWKEQRRFAISVLKELGMVKHGSGRDRMEERIMQGVQDFLRVLGSSRDPEDVVPALRHGIGSVISELIYGVRFAPNDCTWLWLLNLMDEGFKLVGVAAPVNFLPFLRFVPKYHRVLKYIKEGQKKTHALYDELIQRHESSLDPDRIRNFVDAYLVEMRHRGDAPSSFSMEQLHHTMADLFGAGTDTALTTLKWLLLQMILHQDVQEQVAEEMLSVVGHDRLPSLADLPQLSLTQAVINETQRLRSIVPTGIPHGTLQETRLESWRIPSGTMILPLLWAVHRDPELWGEDAHLFRPERFLREDGSIKHHESYMPFQTGSRMCLGEELGRMTIFLFFSAIVHRFHLSFPEGYDYQMDETPEAGITLLPNPYKLVATPREMPEDASTASVHEDASVSTTLGDRNGGTDAATWE